MKQSRFKIGLIAVSAIAAFFIKTAAAFAFCGFYVAQADGDLYNQASQVIITRDGKRTVLTMANDYQGEMEDFALVVPVPVILKEEQVQVQDSEIIERIDSFSAPRLVEYFDDNPCRRPVQPFMLENQRLNAPTAAGGSPSADSLGVTVEEKFDVGEYSIVILSAEESNGLETWLQTNNYNIPDGASQLLQPYIRQNLKFFVAKVNLENYNPEAFSSLRPLQMAFESSRFMLPIRLGTLNAQGNQDLLVYLLSPKGQTEVTNYRTVKIPSNMDLPVYIKEDGKFPEFYQAMFEKSWDENNGKTVFLEYAWDMGSCDPCSAQPLNREELKKAGVFWEDNSVFITRLHLRYNRDLYPQDLRFQETPNRQFFQGRYVIRHPYDGEADCPEARQYYQQVRDRQEQNAQRLSSLTGWSLEQITRNMDFVEIQGNDSEPWWRRIFN
ncbi:Protein of unknown function DUF2330 [Halothece sp. PCC 7418]|uniref:DUF2330 domain-containing protein n=1 Tax=Halothece sp. (strain PCC 7418) TaxID=65093 RepID=UPI0002A072B7|nr:DUF2330 domain-containing protein [Halothece sp. PCC 7418]AFZ43174.1 Protein of unknown function DUF2330 [Halothece sp. PCC 7418]